MNNPKVIIIIFVLVFGVISFITVFNGIKNRDGVDLAEIAEEEVWMMVKSKVSETLLKEYSNPLFTDNPIKLPDRGYSVINSFVDVVDGNGDGYRIFYSAHIQKSFGKWECHYVELLTKTKSELSEKID